MKDDENLWTLYAKGVKKIRATKPQASAKKRIPVTLRGHALTPVNAPPIVAAQPLTLPALERRTERNLRQGDVTVEAKLDLHGKTQSEAYAALARFMAAQAKAGRRSLLIITGKGGVAQKGVLRTNLPDWLQTLPEAGQILALRTAAPKHGGEGAFYVLLRKKK